MNVTVQDDVREKLLIQMFGLLPVEGRLGADAQDHIGNMFELKTTSKSSVSTARDFHQDTIDNYRQRFWIVTTFEAGADIHPSMFKDLYFLAPEHMNAWYQTQESVLNQYGEVCAKAVQILTQQGMDSSDLKTLRGIMTRGSKRNDPNIPMTYIARHGIKLDPTENLCEKITELVAKYPISTQDRVSDGFHFDLFS